MEIDEISLVDRPANQHAAVVIAKREEETVPEEIYNEAGEPVAFDALEEGDVVYDGDGNAYQFTYEPEAQETVEVGKSAFAAPPAPATPSARELYESIRAELSKADDEEKRDEVIAKALSEISKHEQRAAEAERIAKAERDLRLTREYIAKAAEYNVPVDPEELGPVLMRMTEQMSREDCAVVHKALTAAGEMLFEEAGYSGAADNNDPLAQIDQLLDEQVSKSAGQLSKSHAVTGFFDDNPEAYDAYRAQMG